MIPFQFISYQLSLSASTLPQRQPQSDERHSLSESDRGWCRLYFECRPTTNDQKLNINTFSFSFKCLKRKK